MKTIKQWLDLGTAFLEKLDKWYDKKAKPHIVKIDKTPDYLLGRLVYCADCNHGRDRHVLSTLWRYQGRVLCSTCNSDVWEFPIQVRIKFDPEINKKVLASSRKTTNLYRRHNEEQVVQ